MGQEYTAMASRLGFRTVIALAVALGGCSQPDGLFVVPEHKDLGVIKGTHTGKEAVGQAFTLHFGVDRIGFPNGCRQAAEVYSESLTRYILAS